MAGGEKIMKSSGSIRIAFLVGSGISMPADMPSTNELTKQVLSGEGVVRNASGFYSYGEASESTPDAVTLRILKFLCRLKQEIDYYYSRHKEIRHETNYEDLYYMASQIHDSEMLEIDNPVTQPFVDRILGDITLLFDEEAGKIRNLSELARETANYIEDTVCLLLRGNDGSNFDYLECIEGACQDEQRVVLVDILTLNHDTVLERFMWQKGIQFTDGFIGRPECVRHWAPVLFDRNKWRVRLFKLHGSVSWFRLICGDGSSMLCSIPLGQNSRKYNPSDDRPIILVGTFNKMLRYTMGFSADVFSLTCRFLPRTQRLVICGYSFGDKGVNSLVIDWMYSSSDHRIVVIHDKPEELRAKARPAISRNWDLWKTKGRLHVIPRRIEHACWTDIQKELI